jgi:hypothetical protein
MEKEVRQLLPQSRAFSYGKGTGEFCEITMLGKFQALQFTHE